MNDQKKFAIKAIEEVRGDNLARAKHAWSNLTDAEMQSEWGQSGRTPAFLMAGYEAHAKKCDAAIAWLKEIEPIIV